MRSERKNGVDSPHRPPQLECPSNKAAERKAHPMTAAPKTPPSPKTVTAAVIAGAAMCSASGQKPRFDNAVGMKVAAELCAALKPVCERLVVAGSLRRRKTTVGDAEILYIGKTEERQDPADMFASITVNLADEVIAALEKSGVLERRKNVNGSEMYGAKNKLMRHRATGLPVDFFAATAENWHNYLVCRTGPADSNTRICMSAQERGWKWNPYGAGFSRGDEARAMESEEAVFAFVGLPCDKPEARK
jgi:DNA polymerase/3'-5' exonuclease PolX